MKEIEIEKKHKWQVIKTEDGRYKAYFLEWYTIGGWRILDSEYWSKDYYNYMIKSFR